MRQVAEWKQGDTRPATLCESRGLCRDRGERETRRMCVREVTALGTPWSQASSRGEAKDSSLLSSRTGMSWSPLSGLKGVKPPLVFGGRTWDCSPGNARNEGPHLPMTGASRRFSRAVALVWGFSRSKTGSSVSLSCRARAVRSLCTRAQPPAFPRNPRGRLGFPGPTQGLGRFVGFLELWR